MCSPSMTLLYSICPSEVDLKKKNDNTGQGFGVLSESKTIDNCVFLLSALERGSDALCEMYTGIVVSTFPVSMLNR